MQPVQEATMADEIQAQEEQEAEKLYQELLSTAEKLDSREVKPFPRSALALYTNLKTAAAVLLKNTEKLAQEVSQEVIAQIKQAPSLGLAFVFSARRVESLYANAPSGIQEMLDEARPLRRLLLKSADACAEAGIVPIERVQLIYKGRGPIDHAQDCVDLAALFREFEKVLQNKTPVEASQIDRCAVLGSKLLDALRSSSSPDAALLSTDLEEALELRDRFYTLVVQRYDRLWKAAAQILDRKEIEKVFPPLFSQSVTRTTDTAEVKAKKEKAKEAKAAAKTAEKDVRVAVKAAKKK
jgi:hypothetical protein